MHLEQFSVIWVVEGNVSRNVSCAEHRGKCIISAEMSKIRLRWKKRQQLNTANLGRKRAWNEGDEDVESP